ncbi:winged helix-turn-helix transcriptional regulator [Desulfosporosinus lacus]|uniref:Transcriptional regulator, HxlR family n=1 Tax=Desulfosporosinus lacus DSM 15449 TaxID=1121420 RepID=A0A1M6GG63_9FIRM|nr:helix-turn-helix domain-containing protein [Desulfosporosinus lacus]SHJ08922.1 transcriptional regulator, HxlR family [Desulfosporosinus lacus DSM 15449]
MEKDLFGICPYTTAQKVLSGKWSIIILYHLGKKTMRFGELQRQLPDLTQSTLTKQLRALEENGLIERKIYPQVPPKVEYSLSYIGIKFKKVLAELAIWGNEYIETLKDKNC